MMKRNLFEERINYSNDRFIDKYSMRKNEYIIL